MNYREERDELISKAVNEEPTPAHVAIMIEAIGDELALLWRQVEDLFQSLSPVLRPAHADKPEDPSGPLPDGSPVADLLHDRVQGLRRLRDLVADTSRRVDL